MTRSAASPALLLLLLLATACAPAAPVPPAAPDRAAAPARTEILWDTYGVPHIYGRTAEEAMRAFGWAQAHSHGDLLLRLYGESRGRAAEYWGAHNAEADRWVRTVGIPRRAAEWYAAQTPEARGLLDAFAEGINAYGRAHPKRLVDSVHAVLPVTGADVLAHAQRVIHFTFITDAERVAAQVRAARPAAAAGASNAWAVAPQRSASGNALLLANPHLPWSDLYLWYEAHLVAPGIDVSGATLVGFPTLSIAFNDHLGWTHTVNTLDAADVYELSLQGGGYRWNGAFRAFETRADTLRVRGADGAVRAEPFTVRYSVHGPVVAERDGRAFALRVAGLDAAQLFDQYWQMKRATSLAEFEAALARLQMPFFNVVYADRDGHILYVFNGQVPVRPAGDVAFWGGVVRGDTSATLWTRTHAYADLPRLLDPPMGWLQNANDPPWTATIPQRLDPAAFPAYMSPRGMALRPQRSARMLVENPRMSLDDMVRLKHSTRMEMADRVLDDLLGAARTHGGPAARRAADVLGRWDRNADADSRGAVLFAEWAREIATRSRGSANVYATPWDPARPLQTPAGLRDPALAAATLDTVAVRVETRYGALDVPWGEVHRLRRDDVDLPSNGGSSFLGIFRITDHAPAGGGRFAAVGGDTYVAAIEFSTPVRARALLSYGNATQPGSPHRTDQLRLYAEQRLRPVWRTRAEVEANTRERTPF
jgi:acyl-homoserine-lactone acylase